MNRHYLIKVFQEIKKHQRHLSSETWKKLKNEIKFISSPSLKPQKNADFEKKTPRTDYSRRKHPSSDIQQTQHRQEIKNRRQAPETRRRHRIQKQSAPSREESRNRQKNNTLTETFDRVERAGSRD